MQSLLSALSPLGVAKSPRTYNSPVRCHSDDGRTLPALKSDCHEPQTVIFALGWHLLVGKKRVCNTCLNIDLVRCQHSSPGLLKSGWINPGDMTLSHCTTKSTCFTKDGAAIWDKPFTRQCWINFAQKQSLWPSVILSLCLSDTSLDYSIWAKTPEDLSPDSCTCHYTQYLWFNFEYVKADAGYHLGSDGINHLFSCSLSEPAAQNVSSVYILDICAYFTL